MTQSQCPYQQEHKTYMYPSETEFTSIYSSCSIAHANSLLSPAVAWAGHANATVCGSVWQYAQQHRTSNA